MKHGVYVPAVLFAVVVVALCTDKSSKQQFFDKLMNRCLTGFERDRRQLYVCDRVINRFLHYNYTYESIRPFKSVTTTIIDLYRDLALLRADVHAQSNKNIQKMIRKSHFVPICWTLLILAVYNFFVRK